jgi:hypothetical protein
MPPMPQAVPSESLRSDERPPFDGFAPLESNTTCCPDQFFDLVLTHFSRGAVRLVGYALYRTLT